MKILVIGGGMSGLTYATVACKNGHDVTVAERNARVGKKIAASGNGKCNIGNANVSPKCFNKSGIVSRVLNAVSVEEYTEFLKSCGIYTFADERGRMYPLSESASNAVDCLRNQLGKYGAKIMTDSEVTGCVKTAEGYEARINRSKYVFDKVVLACGSRSQALETNAFGIVKQEYFTPLYPSLTPVKVDNMDGTLNGLRVKADVTLYDGAIVLGKESGEVQFKDYGLSGICIFDLSAIIARRNVLRKDGNYFFSLDLVPKISQFDLGEILYHRVKCGEERNKLFYGILHNKIGEYVLKRCKGSDNVGDFAYCAKNLRFDFSKLLDYSMSQVTAGGIDERYVDSETLTLPNGIVALGEVLNVDGVCGGNNLYFAAASALYVFTADERKTAYSKQ
ncbi:MAG: aminoacetone oxidase family FAD-binding enzyme [Corallococcus sp.]|nr:aminoacetone oxidase family FAD-binding enzyme [Corallococcus sp.]